jgi:hypothetical protein
VEWLKVAHEFFSLKQAVVACFSPANSIGTGGVLSDFIYLAFVVQLAHMILIICLDWATTYTFRESNHVAIRIKDSEFFVVCHTVRTPIPDCVEVNEGADAA